MPPFYMWGMHFLYIVPRFHTNLFYATKALIEAGHKVTVLAATRGPGEDYQFVTPEILLDEALSFRAIYRRLQQDRPDVILLRHNEDNWKRFYWVGALLGIKVVEYDQRPADFKRGFFSQLFAMKRGKPPRRISPVPPTIPGQTDNYIPFPIDISPTIATRTFMPDGVLRIVCAAKLAQTIKRHFDLVEAAKRLPGTQRIKITFAGSTYMASASTPEYLQRVLALHGQYTPNIEIEVLQNVPFADMAALYEAHDICVLASEREQLGSAPVEAMGAGTVPVVSNDCGSTRYITNGVNGIIYPMGDIDALSAALLELSDQAKLRRMARGVQHNVLTDLSPAAYVNRMEKLAR